MSSVMPCICKDDQQLDIDFSKLVLQVKRQLPWRRL